jgi:hypothetical protein
MKSINYEVYCVVFLGRLILYLRLKYFPQRPILKHHLSS